MNRDGVIVRTSIIGVIGNVFLVIGKVIIGILAASISIITDAVNNLTDAMSSIVTIIGTKLSTKRPNKQHPYGYGRIEFVTSSIIGMLIFIAGATAVYESIMSLVSGEQPTYDTYSFVIISLAIAVKIGLGLFFRFKGKQASSDALKASGMDALLDSVLSFGTLIGAIISATTGLHLEGYIGIAIGLFILKTAFDVFKESVSKIIGERTDSDFVSEMTEDIMKNDKVFGVYDLIINNYGTDRNIASVHVEVEDTLTAKEIQLLEREIAYLCYEKYHTVMTVGVYAKNTETESHKKIKEDILAVIGDYEEIIQTHGFYIDEEHKFISLDIIISFESKDPDELYRKVSEKLQSMYPEYTVQLILDKDYTVS